MRGADSGAVEVKDLEIGFGVSTTNYRIRLGFRGYGFAWLPGEEESGSNYPSTHFDSGGDEYFILSWLCFVIFYAWRTK